MAGHGLGRETRERYPITYRAFSNIVVLGYTA